MTNLEKFLRVIIESFDEIYDLMGIDATVSQYDALSNDSTTIIVPGVVYTQNDSIFNATPDRDNPIFIFTYKDVFISKTKLPIDSTLELTNPLTNVTSQYKVKTVTSIGVPDLLYSHELEKVE